MSEWFYYDAKGKKHGAYDLPKLQRLARFGRVRPATVLETAGGERMEAGELAGLAFPNWKKQIVPMLCSAFCPGMGQVLQGRKVLGIFFLLLAIISVPLAVVVIGYFTYFLTLAIAVWEAGTWIPNPQVETKKSRLLIVMGLVGCFLTLFMLTTPFLDKEALEREMEIARQEKAARERQETGLQEEEKQNPPYAILSDTEKPASKSREVKVLLKDYATREKLERYAKQIKEKDGKRFAKTTIGYHVQGMDTAETFWATTNFDPELKIEILGISRDFADKIRSMKWNGDEEIIGKWVNPLWKMVVVFMKKGGRLTIVNYWDDTDATTVEAPLFKKGKNGYFTKADAPDTIGKTDYELADDGRLVLVEADFRQYFPMLDISTEPLPEDVKLVRQTQPPKNKPSDYDLEMVAEMQAEALVKKFLKHPLDAKFNWDKKTNKQFSDTLLDTCWVVTGTVKAPNDFGAMLTHPYRVVLTELNKNPKVMSVEIDDEFVYVDPKITSQGSK